MQIFPIRTPNIAVKALLMVLPIFFAASADAHLSRCELHTMLRAMRGAGYTLFANAIQVSDLHNLILSAANNSFTFFAPPDEALYQLDMTTSAPDYVRILQSHLVICRFSYPNLSSFPQVSRLETLLPNTNIAVTRLPGPGDQMASSAIVMVGGVRISAPDLCYSHRIVVHGVDGILNLAIAAGSSTMISSPSASSFMDPSTLVGAGKDDAPPQINFPSPPSPDRTSDNSWALNTPKATAHHRRSHHAHRHHHHRHGSHNSHHLSDSPTAPLDHEFSSHVSEHIENAGETALRELRYTDDRLSPNKSLSS